MSLCLLRTSSNASDVHALVFNSEEATPAAAELILSSGATLLQYPSKVFQICLSYNFQLLKLKWPLSHDVELSFKVYLLFIRWTKK